MFQSMRYIYEVYKEMSFSRAAQKLFISQPSLSAAVKKEEERIDAPIFDRSTNPIHLTEVGQEYIRAVERIMDAVICWSSSSRIFGLKWFSRQIVMARSRVSFRSCSSR